jgi:hypothetical protein
VSIRQGQQFPDDQIEVVFSDGFIAQLTEVVEAACVDVVGDVVRLCAEPAREHPLATPLTGWNTLEVLDGRKRVVYKATVVGGTGLVEVLCLGPRSDNEVYDMAVGLVGAGLLKPDEVTDLWEALAVLDVVEEAVGLDDWDYQPPTAPHGMVRAAIASGLLDEPVAALLSKPELEAAMVGGWGPEGPDPHAALVAALETARARGRLRRVLDVEQVVSSRTTERCGALMARARARCIRRAGHPGPHRAR